MSGDHSQTGNWRWYQRWQICYLSWECYFCFHTVVLFSDLHFDLFGNMHTLFCTVPVCRAKVASTIWVQTENDKGKE